MVPDGADITSLISEPYPFPLTNIKVCELEVEDIWLIKIKQDV